MVNDKSTKIYFIENTTVGFDNGYDGSMFEGANNDLAVYTKLVEDENNTFNKKLAIQALPISSLETMVIPLGIDAKAGGELIFSAKTLNFKEEFSVYLEDSVNNTFTNISEKEYKVTPEKYLNTAERFYIHVLTKTLNIENYDDISKKIDIYKSDKNKITIVGLENNNATVTVYSLLGEEVLKANIANSVTTTLDLPVLSTGVYVVKLNSKVGKKTKKIILD